jgi:hypothetical protein
MFDHLCSGFIPFLVNTVHKESVNGGGSQKVVISTFDSIFYQLGGQLDDDLTEEEAAKCLAWKACIQAKLGDLVVRSQIIKFWLNDFNSCLVSCFLRERAQL